MNTISVIVVFIIAVIVNSGILKNFDCWIIYNIMMCKIV